VSGRTSALRRNRGASLHKQRAHKVFSRPWFEQLEDRTLLSTFTVVNSADAGDGSLRGMLAVAGTGDTINFATELTGQTITLTSGELVVNKSLAILGPGANHLTISGDDASRVFDITGGGLTVTIADLRIAHGRASRGGGIDNAGSTLNLLRCTLSNNEAVGDPGGDSKGGAIFNEVGGTLRVIDSRLTGNLAIGGPADGSGNAG